MVGQAVKYDPLVIERLLHQHWMLAEKLPLTWVQLTMSRANYQMLRWQHHPGFLAQVP